MLPHLNISLSKVQCFQILTPWLVVCKRNIPTERQPLVGEIFCQHLRIEGRRVVIAAEHSRPLISVSWTVAAIFFFQVAPHLWFQHPNIHKYTWTSPGRKSHNLIDHIVIDWKRHSSIPHVRSFRAAGCGKC
jgi:hypothetical protein